MSQEHPQLPPTTAIERDTSLRATTEAWFEYPVRVQPHHTDYSGAVWHGTYLTWMEAARVEYLRLLGMDFTDFVKLGYDLPVVELSLRYHRALRLGEEAVVKTRMDKIAGVRLQWNYRLESLDASQLYLTGQVTLVAVDIEKGRILRELPPVVRETFQKLAQL
jgi:acyl-CoA thioester hydrolase